MRLIVLAAAVGVLSAAVRVLAAAVGVLSAAVRVLAAAVRPLPSVGWGGTDVAPIRARSSFAVRGCRAWRARTPWQPCGARTPWQPCGARTPGKIAAGC